MNPDAYQKTERTTLNRHPERGSYDQDLEIWAGLLPVRVALGDPIPEEGNRRPLPNYLLGKF